MCVQIWVGNQALTPCFEPAQRHTYLFVRWKCPPRGAELAKLRAADDNSTTSASMPSREQQVAFAGVAAVAAAAAFLLHRRRRAPPPDAPGLIFTGTGRSSPPTRHSPGPEPAPAPVPEPEPEPEPNAEPSL